MGFDRLTLVEGKNSREETGSLTVLENEFWTISVNRTVPCGLSLRPTVGYMEGKRFLLSPATTATASITRRRAKTV